MPTKRKFRRKVGSRTKKSRIATSRSKKTPSPIVHVASDTSYNPSQQFISTLLKIAVAAIFISAIFLGLARHTELTPLNEGKSLYSLKKDYLELHDSFGTWIEINYREPIGKLGGSVSRKYRNEQIKVGRRKEASQFSISNDKKLALEIDKFIDIPSGGASGQIEWNEFTVLDNQGKQAGNFSLEYVCDARPVISNNGSIILLGRPNDAEQPIAEVRVMGPFGQVIESLDISDLTKAGFYWRETGLVCSPNGRFVGIELPNYNDYKEGAETSDRGVFVDLRMKRKVVSGIPMKIISISDNGIPEVKIPGKRPEAVKGIWKSLNQQ